MLLTLKIFSILFVIFLTLNLSVNHNFNIVYRTEAGTFLL